MKNQVIQAIDDGHIASYKGKDHHEPQTCKKCGVAWPCSTIQGARAVHKPRPADRGIVKAT